MASSDEAPMKRRITDLRVVDLRQELEKRGLERSGVKAVLVEKLQKALLEEGADPNEIIIDSGGGKGGASRKGTPRRSIGKPDEEHEEHMEEMDTDDLIDGEFLQVDSTGDQSMDGLSQESIDAREGFHLADEDVVEKIEPDAIAIDSVEGEMDDLNDDAINITAEDDQLLTEDEAIGDQAYETGAVNVGDVGNMGSTSLNDKFETTAATDSLGITSGGAGETDSNKLLSDSVADQPGEKQEVDNESLVVHVDEPSLLELEGDLTKPDGKSGAEDSTTTTTTPGHAANAQKAASAGKEKWELETQEKKDDADVSLDDTGKAADSSGDVETSGDNSAAADQDSAGDKLDSLSPPSGDAQRRSGSTSSTSGKPGSEKERRPGAGRVGRNLWVCNLSKTTRAADLKAAFSKYGKVAGAKVVTNARSPGTLCYGFVMMGASSEAQRAMNHLHRTELHGRTIHVEWAGNDPVPGGRKPPLIPPSLLAAEKEKEKEREKEKEEKEVEKVKEEAKTTDAEPVKTEKVDEKPVKTEESEPIVKAEPTTPGKSPIKAEAKTPEVTKEPDSKEASKEPEGKEKSEKSDKDKAKKDILSFDKIKEQRDKDRERNRERGMRETERRRERERQEQFRRQRDLLRRRTREEEDKIRREREQLKVQRMQLEQERLERERLERERVMLEQERRREHKRLEREMALNMQLRIEQEHRNSLKRTMDVRGMPMHDMDPYMGDKKRMGIDGGMIPPPAIIPPPMNVPGGVHNQMGGPNGERRFDNRRDRREDQGGRFGGGRFNRDDNRNQRNERGPPRRDGQREDTRRDTGRRDDTRRDDTRRDDTRRDQRRDEPRREEPRRDEARREDTRREAPRREGSRHEETRKEPPPRREPAPRREEPPKREEPVRRVETTRRSDTRRDEPAGFQRRDNREVRANVQPRGEVLRRAEPPRRDSHQAGRFSGTDKDERRVITTTARADRTEGQTGRVADNQFGNQQGNAGFTDRRRADRDRDHAQPGFRNREPERERGNFNQDRNRFDAGDTNFHRRTSPARGRDNWKQTNTNTDTRRPSGSHDTWKPNDPPARAANDRRVEIRTVEHQRPEAREIIDHSSTFNRGRMSDFQPNIAPDTNNWAGSGNTRPLGGYNDRPLMDDPIPRHAAGTDIGAGMITGATNNWSGGRRDQGIVPQQDRWGGGSSMGGIAASMASGGMSQSSQPLNTMLGGGGGNFGGASGFNTNALGNLINSMNASAGSSSFSLDRHLMQTDNRFDSFPATQQSRRF